MLGSAIHERGAFRRFRNVLEELEIEDAWYVFRDREHQIPYDARGHERPAGS